MNRYRLEGGPEGGPVVEAEPDQDRVMRRCGGGTVYLATERVGPDGLLIARMVFD